MDELEKEVDAHEAVHGKILMEEVIRKKSSS
jgi:hypothetical protein